MFGFFKGLVFTDVWYFPCLGFVGLVFTEFGLYRVWFLQTDRKQDQKFCCIHYEGSRPKKGQANFAAVARPKHKIGKQWTLDNWQKNGCKLLMLMPQWEKLQFFDDA